MRVSVNCVTWVSLRLHLFRQHCLHMHQRIPYPRLSFRLKTFPLKLGQLPKPTTMACRASTASDCGRLELRTIKSIPAEFKQMIRAWMSLTGSEDSEKLETLSVMMSRRIRVNEHQLTGNLTPCWIRSQRPMPFSKCKFIRLCNDPAIYRYEVWKS
jgi:hypothetical protein